MTARGKVWWALAGTANVAVGVSLLLRGPMKAQAPSALQATSGRSVSAQGKPPELAGVAANRTPAARLRLPSGSAVRAAPLASVPVPVPVYAPFDAPKSGTAPLAPALAASAVAPMAATVTAGSGRPRVADKLRQASLAPLATWTKPGLCSTSEEAQATRDKLTESFRQLDAGEQGKFFLDPRLPEDSEKLVLGVLATARAVAKQGLGLEPPPPQVFAYFDQQLMKAAACINEDVVAFYDGALHIVLGRPDLQQSVTHEYAHHALFSSGLLGPAWAQEGIAMNLAGETWWRERARLQAMLQAPFSAQQMDELIPYKLEPQQAVGFYVQAALSVKCLLQLRGWSLQQLADALRGGSGADSVTYELPELAESSFLGSCAAQTR